ncbi:hypothetical protein Tco_0215670 [Tanacetum coccineum]
MILISTKRGKDFYGKLEAEHCEKRPKSLKTDEEQLLCEFYEFKHQDGIEQDHHVILNSEMVVLQVCELRSVDGFISDMESQKIFLYDQFERYQLIGVYIIKVKASVIICFTSSRIDARLIAKYK